MRRLEIEVPEETNRDCMKDSAYLNSVAEETPF
jgi:hypothetical protein